MSSKKNQKNINKETELPHDEMEKTLFFDLKSIKSKEEKTSKSESDIKKEEKEILKSEKKTKKLRDKEKSKENRNFFRIIWIVMIVLVTVVLTKYILVGVKDMLALDKEETTVTISLPANPKLNEVTKILKDNEVIDNTSFFKLYAILTKSGKAFSGGTFEVRRNMDYEALINYLETQLNRTDIVKLTFPEGININECANLLESNEVCSKEDFFNICKSDEFDEKYSFIKSIPNKDERYYKLEGYLFPDTYQFYKNEQPYNVVDKLLTNFNQKLNSNQKVDGYDQKVNLITLAADKSISIENLITISSIIQAEAANKNDMYMVSSVLYNRLKTLPNQGINSFGEYGLGFLGEDSTVWYPYRNKWNVPSDIVDSFTSNYNTYKIEGLPPGPICNPGKEAIDAALNPKSTDYYYFCHSKDGTAYYGKTINEHNKNLVTAGLTK